MTLEEQKQIIGEAVLRLKELKTIRGCLDRKCNQWKDNFLQAEIIVEGLRTKNWMEPDKGNSRVHNGILEVDESRGYIPLDLPSNEEVAKLISDYGQTVKEIRVLEEQIGLNI